MTATQSWFGTAWTLLRAARRRASARMGAQSKRNRSMSPGMLFGISLFSSLMFQFFIATIFLQLGGVAGELAEKGTGKIVVSSYVISAMTYRDEVEAWLKQYDASLTASGLKPESKEYSKQHEEAKKTLDKAVTSLQNSFRSESRSKANKEGGSEADWNERLTKAYAAQGKSAFREREGSFWSNSPASYGALTLFIAIWWLSLVLQGEGIALDVTRRRHPIWEWYLAFPVKQSAVFTAEAIAPAVANPFLLASPVMLATLVGSHTGSFFTGLCALPLAIPLTLAAAIWAKALEVLIMLRCSLRSRSAWFALISGVGIIAMFMPLMLAQSPAIARRILNLSMPLSEQFQGLGYLLDVNDAGDWLRAAGVVIAISLALVLPAYAVLRFAVARGLETGFGGVDAVLGGAIFRPFATGNRNWLADPLLQKERLWLKRDRGALVQLVGIPLLLVGLQFFNLHNMLHDIELSWNKLAAIVVGLATYMLFVSGPRALLSEGPALTLTLSWPRSLEDTLRMKVRLLFTIVSVMVWVSLIALIWMFPSDAGKLVAVGLVWPLFGLSIAEKAVTLIRAPSQAGEPEPLPQSQLWAASLGNLTFAIGLFTQQWQLAIAAIALNWVFAGALWQGFRHRLAYLFDPQSEPDLRPPTILSSVVAIVAVMEIGAIISIPFIVAVGADAALFARAMGYGVAAFLVCLFVWRWHSQRGVSLRDILCMDDTAHLMPAVASLGAIGLGISLGLVGVGYQHLLHYLPWTEVRDALKHTSDFFAESPNARTAYAIMAVGIAPWVEEFLFRGLMFRAMVPQWGMPLAILSSTAFFTVLHPALSWPMVFCLGALSAYLFCRVRSLFPCFLLHLSYNATIISLST